jgi:hypothetical protein
MADFKESGQEFPLLALRFESDTVVRLPMSVAVGMRVWGLFDELRKDRGVSVPSTPASTYQVQ